MTEQITPPTIEELDRRIAVNEGVKAKWRGNPDYIRTLDVELYCLRAVREQFEAKAYCCCGDNANHSSWSGHSPVSMYDHALFCAQKQLEAIARAVFGEGWRCCCNLVPYVQGVVNELADAREILSMFSPDDVDHHRDLIEQCRPDTGPLKDAPQVPQGTGVGAENLEHTPHRPVKSCDCGIGMCTHRTDCRQR